MSEPSGKEEISAGGVVVRAGPRGPEVLIAEQNDWNTGARNVRLPKGHLEDGETLEQAALREVEEEVGVRAAIVGPLTPLRYTWWHEKKQKRMPKVVQFFLMDFVSGDARPADGEMERIHWVPLAEAQRRLTFENEQAVVEEAGALLASRHPSGS